MTLLLQLVFVVFMQEILVTFMFEDRKYDFDLL